MSCSPVSFSPSPPPLVTEVDSSNAQSPMEVADRVKMIESSDAIDLRKISEERFQQIWDLIFTGCTYQKDRSVEMLKEMARVQMVLHMARAWREMNLSLIE